MKNSNSMYGVMIALLTTSTAFAQGHGVERVLPADATNVRVTSVSVGYDVTSQTLLTDGQDGPVYQNNYSPVLDVTVSYDSSDTSDNETALNTAGVLQVVGGPVISFHLPLSAADAKAINQGELDTNSMIEVAVNKKMTSVSEEVFGPSCKFNNDFSQPENPECIEHVTTQSARPVLVLVRK